MGHIAVMALQRGKKAGVAHNERVRPAHLNQSKFDVC